MRKEKKKNPWSGKSEKLPPKKKKQCKRTKVHLTTGPAKDPGWREGHMCQNRANGSAADVGTGTGQLTPNVVAEIETVQTQGTDTSALGSDATIPSVSKSDARFARVEQSATDSRAISQAGLPQGTARP